MKVIEPPLASICQDMIDCIGNKDAEPEIITFFYRMQQLYLKGWRECGFCKGTGRVTTVYLKLAREHKFSKLVIERCDRLTRFNYEFLVEYFESHGVQIEYLDTVLGTSFESDLVKDILSIIMVFSAKLYGKRSKENKLKMKELKQIGVA